MGQNAKIPIKWMPPESIYYQYYDEKTDVVCINTANLHISLSIVIVIKMINTVYVSRRTTHSYVS